MNPLGMPESGGAAYLDPSRTTWPGFICGCHRSGSTLLRVLLDSHPHIACPPESKFIAGLERFIAYPQVLRGLETLGIPPANVVRDLGELTKSWLSAYATARGKVRWIDKTPNYFRLLQFIDLLLNQDVYYIMIVRHPLDVVESLREAPGFWPDPPEDPDIAESVAANGRSREAWAKYWVHVNTILRGFRDTHGTRCTVCRYEDLVMKPASTLTEVLSFIGEHSSSWSCDWHDRLHGYGDWKIKHSQTIYQTSVDRWRRLPADVVTPLWEIVGPLAEALGYSTTAYGA